ncbi:hypothetical protein D3C79_1057830 [compost metagenome]
MKEAYERQHIFLRIGKHSLLILAHIPDRDIEQVQLLLLHNLFQTPYEGIKALQRYKILLQQIIRARLGVFHKF